MEVPLTGDWIMEGQDSTPAAKKRKLEENSIYSFLDDIVVEERERKAPT
jgi:hypothetical protein